MIILKNQEQPNKLLFSFAAFSALIDKPKAFRFLDKWKS